MSRDSQFPKWVWGYLVASWQRQKEKKKKKNQSHPLLNQWSRSLQLASRMISITLEEPDATFSLTLSLSFEIKLSHYINCYNYHYALYYADLRYSKEWIHSHCCIHSGFITRSDCWWHTLVHSPVNEKH